MAESVKMKEKDLRLVNIYIKIHNKMTLFMDDLAYLAEYNPVCFKKTCDNIVYKMGAAKDLAEPSDEIAELSIHQDNTAEYYAKNNLELEAAERLQNEQMIQQFIGNLKKAESGEISTLQNIDIEQVEELLGDLFMENLFPHDGMQGYFEMAQEGAKSKFNAKA